MATAPAPSILVTGCAGFIGGNFVRIFKQRFPKMRIIGLDDLSTGRREALSSGITFYEGSIVDERLTEKIFKKHRPQYIFHFAALPAVAYSVEHPFKTTMINTAGTARLLELAARYGAVRFIFSSTFAVYGTVRRLPIIETQPLQPLSPYGLQKQSSEALCKLVSELHGLDTICLRYANAFGPGQYGDSAYANVVSGWLEGMFFPKAKKLFIEGDGKQSRDFCYVDNIVEANIKAMQAKGVFKGQAMNIGSGEQISLLTLRQLVEKHAGRSLTLEKRASRPGDIKHSLADIKLARRLIGYRPIVSFEAGLQQTIQWFEKRAM